MSELVELLDAVELFVAGSVLTLCLYWWCAYRTQRYATVAARIHTGRRASTQDR